MAVKGKYGMETKLETMLGYVAGNDHLGLEAHLDGDGTYILLNQSEHAELISFASVTRKDGELHESTYISRVGHDNYRVQNFDGTDKTYDTHSKIGNYIAERMAAQAIEKAENVKRIYAKYCDGILSADIADFKGDNVELGKRLVSNRVGKQSEIHEAANGLSFLMTYDRTLKTGDAYQILNHRIENSNRFFPHAPEDVVRAITATTEEIENAGAARNSKKAVSDIVVANKQEVERLAAKYQEIVSPKLLGEVRDMQNEQGNPGYDTVDKVDLANHRDGLQSDGYVNIATNRTKDFTPQIAAMVADISTRFTGR